MGSILSINQYGVFVGKDLVAISTSYDKMLKNFKGQRGNNVDFVHFIVDRNTGAVIESSVIYHTYPYL